MRILIVHPEMKFLGGGERLCCETIHSLLSLGHEITLLSQIFDPKEVESFFGYANLFNKVELLLYPSNKARGLGTTSHLIQHSRGQMHALKQPTHSRKDTFDLVFSTQDAGYIPDINAPVVQWGYFPTYFPKFVRGRPPGWFAWTMRSIPLRFYYRRKVSRIGLVLAISQYSKWHLDSEWKRPSSLVYPGCNMIDPGVKRNLVVTVARANPVKRLELFWQVARLCPNYEFAMLLTLDPDAPEYVKRLMAETPKNGRTILNPPKERYSELLGEAKVYLHLMENEHFGITVVEAMSASCVPVVHNSGGPREIVTSGTGFRWQMFEQLPSMVDQAMEESPSLVARQRAEAFSVERFEKRLSSVFSLLQK